MIFRTVIELEIYCAQTYCYISDLMKPNWRLVDQISLHRNTREARGYVGDTRVLSPTSPPSIIMTSGTSSWHQEDENPWKTENNAYLEETC